MGIALFDSSRASGGAKVARGFVKVKNNFKITVTGRWPWPFSWGPFSLRQTRVLRGNTFTIKIWQRNHEELGDFTHVPIEVECSSTNSLEAKTACSVPACGSKKGVLANRRTKV
jgi:hypothetical protein